MSDFLAANLLGPSASMSATPMPVFAASVWTPLPSSTTGMAPGFGDAGRSYFVREDFGASIGPERVYAWGPSAHKYFGAVFGLEKLRPSVPALFAASSRSDGRSPPSPSLPPPGLPESRPGLRASEMVGRSPGSDKGAWSGEYEVTTAHKVLYRPPEEIRKLLSGYFVLWMGLPPQKYTKDFARGGGKTLRYEKGREYIWVVPETVATINKRGTEILFTVLMKGEKSATWVAAETSDSEASQRARMREVNESLLKSFIDEKVGPISKRLSQTRDRLAALRDEIRGMEDELEGIRATIQERAHDMEAEELEGLKLGMREIEGKVDEAKGKSVQVAGRIGVLEKEERKAMREGERWLEILRSAPDIPD